jgi:hypothetical protein
VDYAGDDPIMIWIRRRGRRYDLDDDGAAVARAGKPADWLSISGHLVARESFNINRRGVVFVPVVERRDIAALACRLAQACRSVYLTLLEY